MLPFKRLEDPHSDKDVRAVSVPNSVGMVVIKGQSQSKPTEVVETELSMAPVHGCLSVYITVGGPGGRSGGGFGGGQGEGGSGGGGGGGTH
mmetsp:Transcript_4606/g.8723  ORF Transcript_4606/g.8723 Transcript_4606/m.8723 type:complete len:91 (-) Transcript_4606:2231-2503(-)